MNQKLRRYTFLLLILLALPIFSFAQAADEPAPRCWEVPEPPPGQVLGLDERIDQAFRPVANCWEVAVFYPAPLPTPFDLPIVLYLLIAGAVFFTVVFGFINIRKFPLAINVVRGKYDDLEMADDPEHRDPHVERAEVNIVEGDIPDTIKDESHHGEVNHFQALATAVSGTVGLGNIAGVAIAVGIGGPGATLWMIIAGLLGMSSKFVECTLGVKYRDIDKDGIVHGGPMYYLSRGFAELKLGPLGKVLAVVFAIFCVGGSFGGGNAFQANQATSQITTMFGLAGDGAVRTIIGIVMAILVAIVIIGGIKRIAKVTEKLVPLMAVIYIIASIIIILYHFTEVPAAISMIIAGAFTPEAGVGGIAGVIIQGFRRAAFSNEAGAGSAAIAHSAVRTKYPASEGLVALLEPFIDTVVICTMTAIVIVLFNMQGDFFQYGGIGGNVMIGNEAVNGVDLTARAYNDVLPGFNIVLTVAIVLFAFSTMISWSYYGLQSWKYLFGRSKASDLSFKILFCIFVVIGAAASLGSVLAFSDAMILAMVFPNMIGLFFLFPRVREELARYLKAIGKA
ncbi:MAG TPA: alanine/glycine:cation symporter family protein [Pyrinomonadaceae bacterium]|nr:alanine/glycine:cation symporter family protein [Pyrinomonadaceae bacterium]